MEIKVNKLKPLNFTIKYLLILTLIFISCGKEIDVEELKSIVEENILVFQESDELSDLTNIFENNEVVIFGETHYVQEHQDFIIDLLPDLSSSGYRVVYQELFHCFNWIVEDYINGKREDLPEFLLYFDATLIDGIKAFNNTVADEFKIGFRYMDVNHWKSNFTRSIEEIEKTIGPQSFFNDIKNVAVDTRDYTTTLQNTIGLLSQNENEFKSELGDRWYERIFEMIEVEIMSSNFRTERNSSSREKFMFDQIVSGLEDDSGNKVIINTGMFHGQKQTYMGENIMRIGQLLDASSWNVYSIAFIGVKGETKPSFDATENNLFDLVENASDENLIRIIDDISGKTISFLSLQNEVFISEKVKVSYTSSTKIEATIGLQFDAIISYPAISTLQSMDIYDWRK